MRLYIVFGEHSDRLAEHLAGSYEIAGQDRTLEAAVAAVTNLSPDAFPDVFLVLGKALASGVVHDSVNHGAALVAQLQKLRRACPRSRVIVILSASADDSLVHSIAKLGIYDIHRVDSVSVEDLKHFIENPKSYADYDIEIKGEGNPGSVVVRDTKNEERLGLKNRIRLGRFIKTKLQGTTPGKESEVVSIREEHWHRDERPDKPDCVDDQREGGAFLIDQPVKEKAQPSIQDAKKGKAHRVLTVWNPSGSFKTWTALNLAVAAAKKHDVALVNLDLVCPELDAWFGVKQTMVERRREKLTHGAGIMTFGESLPVEIVPKMLQEYGWGVKYLPAGNKLGNIGTPDFDLDTIERVIQAVVDRDASRPALTILNAASCFELPCSYGALKAADTIVIPTSDCPQEAEVVTRQIGELRRVGVDGEIIEVLWTLGNAKREPVWPGIERIVVPRDDAGYLATAAKRNPYAATENGQSLWEKVLMEIQKAVGISFISICAP